MIDDSKNIVVFGCDGMLGQDLMEMFSYQDGVYVKGYNKIQCDISDREDVWSYIGDTHGSITNVINCAAYTNVDGCEDNPDLAYLVNDKAVKNLAEICLENQIHLTHVSTDYVFEGLASEPYLEQSETIPLSVYGKSKLAGEGHVRAMGNKGLIIRTSWLYGKNGKNFIDSVINKLDLGTPAKVVNDQIGSPTYTMDLANAIIQLVMAGKSGIYHITNSGQCSWYELAVKAAQFVDLNPGLIQQISSKDLKRKAERPAYSVLNMKRYNDTFPEPMRSWEDALYQYLLETKRIYEY